MILKYFFGRYFAFFLAIINSFLVAKYLGVYYFGIYSFIFLISQYLNYFGILPSYSLSAILASYKEDEDEQRKNVWQNSLSLSLILIVLLLLISLFMLNYIQQNFEDYNIQYYKIYILLIFFLTTINNLYINLYRVYGKLLEINFNQVVQPLLTIIILLLYKEANGKNLLLYILVSLTVANVMSLLIFIKNSPIRINFQLNRNLLADLLKRGFHLLLFNLSFYFILLISRSLVSIYFSAEKLGIYSLGVNIANAVFLATSSISFIIFPKMINRLAINKNSAIEYIYKARQIMIDFSFLLTYVSLIVIPILIENFLPNYVESIKLVEIFILGQLILNLSYGYNIYLISLKKERILTIFSFFSILLLVVASFSLKVYIDSLIIYAVNVLLSYSLYSFLVIFKVRKNLFEEKQAWHSLSYYIERGNRIMPLVFLLVSLIVLDKYFIAISFFLYCLFNYNSLKNSFLYSISLISGKSFLKI